MWSPRLGGEKLCIISMIKLKIILMKMIILMARNIEYRQKIKEAVRNDDIKSIGVYGKWCIWKTSIIKNTIYELIDEKEYEENEIDRILKEILS